MAKFSGEMKPEETKKVTASGSTVSVTFLENRKFELTLGNKIMMTFLGRETKQMPSEWLDHIDWQNIKMYFMVKGV
jgi:hypothetical protein